MVHKACFDSYLFFFFVLACLCGESRSLLTGGLTNCIVRCSQEWLIFNLSSGLCLGDDVEIGIDRNNKKRQAAQGELLPCQGAELYIFVVAMSVEATAYRWPE